MTGSCVCLFHNSRQILNRLLLIDKEHTVHTIGYRDRFMVSRIESSVTRFLLINVLWYIQNRVTCTLYIAVNAAHLSKPLEKLLKGAKKMRLLPGNPSPVTFSESKMDMVSRLC